MKHESKIPFTARSWRILRQAVRRDASPPNGLTRNQDSSLNGLEPESPATAWTFLLALLLCGVCFAEQDPPKHARVSVQFIEVAHPVLTELLHGEETGGAALHAKSMDLAKSGKAKILETCMVVCRSQHKATVESIREEIYPSEYEPGGLGSLDISERNFTDFVTRSYPTFEVRNTGMTLKAEVTIDENTNHIELRFFPEFVRRIRLDTWFEHKDQWGDSTMRWPVYEKWSANTSLSLQSGKFELTSVINPKGQAPPPAVTRRVLLFVRADIIETPASP